VSSAAIDFPAVRAREEAEAVDEELMGAARQLLASGPVIFKWSRRVPAKLIPRWQRAFYVAFCRKAKGKLKTPPGPAMQLNTYSTFGRAFAKCETPDDQILVMPLDHDYYRPDVLDVAVECRPKDETDAGRTNALRAVFESADAPRAGEDASLTEALRDVEDCRRTVRRLRT
jgi:hypothetical protein